MVVLRGRLELTHAGVRVAELGAGAHLGEMALIDEAARSVTATALEPGKVLAIRRDDFYEVLRREPALAVKLLWSFVRVLAAVLTDGLDAVEAAIREALDAGAASDEVILNILARYREPATDRPLDVVVDLKLSHPPMADCARYDTVRGLDAGA